MDLSIFFKIPLAIQIHIVAAISAFILGVAMFVRRKGTQSHKMIGRLFVVAMLATAISALFIRYLNDGRFSWIHIFVPLTFFAVWEAIYYIRKGDVRRHKRAVTGLFFGALLIPGIFSFLPGRIMHLMVFG